MRNKNNKNREYYKLPTLRTMLIGIGLVVVAICLIGSMVIYYNIKNISIVKNADYRMNGEIIKVNTTNITRIGISADTDKLDFGRAVFNTTNSTKIIDIYNPTNRTIITFMLAEGNITRLLEYKSSLIVKHHTKQQIYIKMTSSEVGNFSGEMQVLSLYPHTSLSEKIMLYLYKHNLLKYVFPQLYNRGEEIKNEKKAG